MDLKFKQLIGDVNPQIRNQIKVNISWLAVWSHRLNKQLIRYSNKAKYKEYGDLIAEISEISNRLNELYLSIKSDPIDDSVFKVQDKILDRSKGRGSGR